MAEDLKWLCERLSEKKSIRGCNNCIDVAHDVDETKEMKLEQEKHDFPRLVLFFFRGEFRNAVVVADNIRIDTQASDIPFATVVLIGAYSAFGVDFPPQWRDFLIFLKHVILQKVENIPMKVSDVISEFGFSNVDAI